MGDVVPGARRYPAEETETRLLAPASLSAGAAIPGLADSQLLGSARTDRKQQVCCDDLQDNSTHANQRSQASMDGVPEPDDDGTSPTLQPSASASYLSRSSAASAKILVCTSTSAKVVEGHIKAMLWNGVSSTPRFTRNRCRYSSRSVSAAASDSPPLRGGVGQNRYSARAPS